MFVQSFIRIVLMVRKLLAGNGNLDVWPRPLTLTFETGTRIFFITHRPVVIHVCAKLHSNNSHGWTVIDRKRKWDGRTHARTHARTDGRTGWNQYTHPTLRYGGYKNVFIDVKLVVNVLLVHFWHATTFVCAAECNDHELTPARFTWMFMNDNSCTSYFITNQRWPLLYPP
jgi:hypothetical protein